MANARGIKAGSTFIELFLNDSKLVRGLQNASKKLKAFGDTITGWGKKMTAAGAAVVAPLLGGAKVFSEMGDRMAKMSRRTGISVETLSELGYAAELSGADLDTLEGSLRKMQKTLVAAADKSGTAAASLGELGLTAADLRGLSPDQQFKRIADGLAGIESPARRATLATKIFGLSGAQLLPLMSEGAKGIEALQQEARDLHLPISAEDAKAAEALNDDFDRLWKVIKHTSFIIGAALAPKLQGAIKWIIDTVVAVNDWIDSNREIVVTILKVAGAVVAGGLSLLALGGAISTMGTIFGALAAVVTGVIVALNLVIAVIFAILSPVGLVIVAIAELGVYLLYVSGAGGKALSWLRDRFTDLATFASESFQGISDALMAGDIALAAKILWLSLKIIWRQGVHALGGIWDQLLYWWEDLLDSPGWGDAIRTLGKYLLRTWASVMNAWNKLTDVAAEFIFRTFYETGQDELKKDLARIDALEARGQITPEQAASQRGLAHATWDTYDQKQSAMNKSNADANFRARLDAASEFGRIKSPEEKHAASQQRRVDKALNDFFSFADDPDLEKLKAERGGLLKKARDEKKAKELDRLKPRPPKPPEIPDYLEGLSPTIEQAQKTVGVAGTFNAMEAPGMSAGGATDRLTRAAEETAKGVKKLVDQGEQDDQEFGG